MLTSCSRRRGPRCRQQLAVQELERHSVALIAHYPRQIKIDDEIGRAVLGRSACEDPALSAIVLGVAGLSLLRRAVLVGDGALAAAASRFS